MKASEKISAALMRIRGIVKENKAHVIRSQQMRRADRELLVRTKWLQEIIKGWYLLVRPEDAAGESSTWYVNFWDFLRIYLNHHFGGDYCLSAENSIDLHTASTTIPRQVIAISSKGGGPQKLPFDTSIFVYPDRKNLPEERITINGINVMTLPLALCRISASYFQKNPKDAEIALRLVKTPSDLTQIILKYNFKSSAQRLIGAYDFLGNKELVDDLVRDFAELGWKLKGENPFTEDKPLLLSLRLQSPYVARILSLWREFRETVIKHFPKEKGIPKKPETYLAQVKELYEKDAYNSLSIEGYQVDEELIEKVQNNKWSPDFDDGDAQTRNALAARGYYEAFLEVKKSLESIFQKENPGKVIQKNLSRWYQKLFSSSARAGIIRELDLLGYRKGQVYIRGSRHVPLPKEALVDAMETLFDCLKNEKHAAVRAVLGHYIFVYIHPYMDGNGRIGRFLMNAMFASGGYPWTIIRAKNRREYLVALELAGVENNIEPFAKFIAKEMEQARQTILNSK
jgi:hypothetical protein